MSDADEPQKTLPDFTKGVPAADVPDGGKLVGRVGDDEVLIVRLGGELFAIGAHCTHYQGPLGEGLIVGDTVRCPWHHAHFCLRTGVALAAPALDPLKRWVVQADPAHAQFLSAVLCLGLFTSARIAEQVRAGIQSLPRGQRNAGMAVGLTELQVYRFVLLPMAFRIVIPPLTSETMNLIKNSSIALTIGLAELTFRSREMGEYTFRFFEAFSAATLIYIAIGMTANRVMAFVEKRVAVPGFIASGGK